MIRWFKSRRPTPTQPPKPEGWDDRNAAHAHGIPLTTWATLPPATKTELRAGVAAALNERNAA